MKKCSILVILLVNILVNIKAQECLTGSCTLSGAHEYPIGPFTPTTSWQTKASMNAGNWTLFNVSSGQTYEWTYCEEYGGISTSWDAQLTLRNHSNGSVLCYSDDVCGTNGNAPYIRWTATFTGIVQLLTSVYNCTINSGSPYNRLAYRQVGGSTYPDLTITTASATPSTIVAGNTTTINYSLRNQGNATAGSSYSSFWLDNNNNGIFDGSPTDIWLADQANSSISAGTTTSYSRSITIPSYVLGSKNIMVACDATSIITESNESNNQYFIPISVSAPLPDLTITTASASPTTIVAGYTTSFNYSLRNQGNSTAASSISSIWLDNNNNGVFDGSPTDIWLTDQANASIAAGVTTSYSLTVTIPSGVSGNKRIMVGCDGTLIINESNESNNQYFVPIIVTAPLPDLILTSANTSPSTIVAGNTTTVTYSLRNQGNSTASSSYSSFWLDNNNNGVFDGSPTDIWLSDQANSSIAAGITTSYNKSVTIPSYVLGNKNIIVACDATSIITESNESNNQYFTPITVTSPDLIISTASASPTTIGAGNETTVIYSLRNQGSASATSSYSSFWLDNNNNGIFDGSPTDIWLADQANSSIAAGVTTSYSLTVTIPSGVLGSKRIMVGCDGTLIINESDESNNQYFIPIIVTASLPDLVITTANASPTTVVAGSPTTVNYSLRNQGNIAAGSSYSSFWLDNNNNGIFDGEPTDIWITDQANSSIAAGVTTSYSKSVTIPNGVSGNKGIMVGCDANLDVNESYENNNQYFIPIIVNSINAPTFYSTVPASLYPTKSYSIQVDYTDNAGASNLQNVYLRLAQNDDEGNYRLTMMWQLNGNVVQWEDEAQALTGMTATRTNITNGYRVTWNFTLLWNWNEHTNIDYWAFSINNSAIESSHTKQNQNAFYENDIRISSSTENADPISVTDNYIVTGIISFEGTTLTPDDWEGISVEMRKTTVGGTILDNYTSVSGEYSVNWATQASDAGTYNIYIVPKNTNHEPPNDSDNYWDLENVTINSAQATIQFAGMTWNVKNGTGGPGPNNWSSSTNSVWVDGNGYLHLKIRKVGNTWYCAEIWAQQSLGHGEYRFYVGSNVETYDQNVVVGLFNYESDIREIDIEFARWGNPSNVVGNYVVQPDNSRTFPLNLTGDYSTHKYIWNSTDIFFQSYHGHYATLPSSEYLINQWTYSGDDNPPVGNERLDINFWLHDGNPPANQQEAELIIQDVEFIPSSPDIDVTPPILLINQTDNNKSFKIQGDNYAESEKSKILADQLEGTYKEMELLIKFNDNIDLSLISSFEEDNGLEMIKKYKIVKNLYLYRIIDNQSVAIKATQLLNFPLIEFVEPNGIVALTDIPPPNDPGCPDLYGLHNTGQDGGTADADIDAPEAWEIATGNTSVVVGIIDTGIDYDHPDLSANIWTNSNEIPGNGIDDDDNGYIDDIHGWDFFYDDAEPTDIHGHGTHVAGTVGAVGNNSIGVTGVCWNVKLMVLKVTSNDASPGFSFNDKICSALEYATSMGATLTNNSFEADYSNSTRLAILNSNMIFVASAGNGGSDEIGDNNDFWPHYPSNYDCENIIAVAALNRFNNISTFSNYGSTSVDVGAYGASILSTRPINPMSGECLDLDPTSVSSDEYCFKSGTSMAAPQVAGLAALLYSYNPNLSWSEVKDAIMDNVVPVPALDGKTVTGGCINAFNSISNSGPGSFEIHNTGSANLSITSISDNRNWLTISGYPSTPFTIGAGNTQTIDVSINWSLVGSTPQTGNITIASNDPDEPSVTVQVTAVPYMPDLTITAGTQSISLSTVSAGSNITAYASESNSGTGTSGPNVVGLWLSTDNILSGIDTHLGYISGFPGLAPNSNSPVLNSTVNIPSTIPAGNYYLFFWADGDQTINELDDENNFASTQITVTTPTCNQPSNDGCSGSYSATQIPFGSTCSPITSSSCGATSSGFSSCDGTQDDDVFFSFIPTTTSATITVVSSSGYNAVFQVLSGPCGTSMTPLACINDTGTGETETTTVSGLNPGVTYYIRVWHYSIGYGTTGNFTICVYGCSNPANPANPTSNSPQCGNVTITRSGSPPSGETWYWQGTSCGTSTSLGSGNTFTATSSGNYNIRSYNSACGTWSSGCGSTAVTVYPTPATPATPTSNSPQCGSVTITRSGSPPAGETWYWQGTSCGTSTSLGSGTTYTAASTGTYYIRSYNSACGTWSSGCGSTAVTVYPTPATPATPTSNSPQCGSVTITRTGSPPAGETWYWQGTSCGTSTTLGSGATYTATSSGTYYIRSYNSSCDIWSPGCGSLAVIKNITPGLVVVNGGYTSCNSAILTASGGSGGTIYWQGTTSNGTSTATPSTVQTVTASGTYYFRAYNSCGWGTQGSATVTIVTTPGSVSVSGGGTSCNSALLSASGGYGGTIYWQGTTSNGTSLETPSTSQTVTTSGTYYFNALNACGWGPQGSATVTINTTPIITGTTPGSRCGSGTVTLGATASEGTINWYAASTGGSSLGSGNTFTTPAISATTFYYVDATTNGCTTASRTPVIATVNSLPLQPDIIQGPASVCQNLTYDYSISSDPNVADYIWILPPDWSGTSTSTSINVTAGANSGTISVMANNSCGTSPSRNLTVTVTPAPSQPGDISGNINVGPGSTQIYSILPVVGATSYTWLLPSEWNGYSNTSSITTTVGSTGGDIFVFANNSCGSSLSSTLNINIASIPTIGISPIELFFGFIMLGSNSSSQSYAVTGVNLTESITVSAPFGYSVSSVSSGPWTTSITLPQMGGNINTTVYVRFNPTVATEYSGNIINSSAGAITKNIAVSGTGIENNLPVISNSVNGNIYVNYSQMVTPATSYQITAANLIEDLTIVANSQSSTPGNCQLEISLTPDGGYSTLITLSPVDGSINATIYVKPSCDDVPVYITGTITQSSPGANNDVINVYFENEYYYLYAPVVTIGDIQANAGQVVYIPMTATNFNSIGIAEYYINYDPNVLSYIGIENVHESLPNFNICNNCSDPYSCCPVDPIDYILSYVTVIDQTHYRLYIEAKLEISHFNVPDGQEVFEIVFNYSGGYSDLDFSGGEYYYSGNPGPFYNPEIINEPFEDYYINGSVSPVIKTLNLSLNLEGLYSPALGKMRKARGASGDYFSGTIADQITVKLASGTFPYSFVYEIDSIELDQDGHCAVNVPFDFNGNYYIVVSHRNSIETWTAFPVSIDGNGLQYDFTIAINSAYGENMKFINGTFCFFGGDVNQDGFVDTGDMSTVDNESGNFTTGYISADVNGDGIVDTGDMIILDNNGSSFVGTVTPVGTSTLPSVTTAIVTNVAHNTAISGGVVISQGSSPVVTRGVCWGLSLNPTIEDSHTFDGTGAGSYISALSGLLPETTYHLRAYATNNTGTSYGTDISFTTSLFSPGEGVTDIDGNVYTSVILGNQEWLVQNLKTTHFANGELIPNITDNTQWGSLTSSAWTWYNNSSQFENPYGKLYNWYSVADAQHLCPTGWHVPTDQEWTILTDYLGGLTVADEKLKEAGTAHWPDPNNGTNASGFTGVPGGNRSYLGHFSYLGQRACWWSSTENNAVTAWGRVLGYDYTNATTGYFYKNNGYSVRCLKD
ncbi:MAG: CARDB domain-containing protein [Bacteroidota bacterium]